MAHGTKSLYYLILGGPQLHVPSLQLIVKTKVGILVRCLADRLGNEYNFTLAAHHIRYLRSNLQIQPRVLGVFAEESSWFLWYGERGSTCEEYARYL